MNKQRYWAGIGLFAVEVIALAVYGLTQIRWNWLTIRLALITLIVTAIALYNGIAFLLVWFGSKKEQKVRR